MNIKKPLLLIFISIILVSCAYVTPTSPTSTPEAIKLQQLIDDVWIDGIAVGLDESIWLLASGKVTDHDISLVNFLNGNIAIYKVPESVFCESWDYSILSNLVADSKGVVWFSSGCKIFRFDGKDWETYSYGEGVPEGPPALAVDADDNLWIGTDSGTISKFNGTRLLIYYQDEVGLDSVDCIFISPEDDLWVGGYSGIAHFAGDTWNTYETRGRYDQRIRVVDLDISSNGDIWVVAHGGGDVLYFDGKKWITVVDVPPAMVTSILVEKNGNVWVGGIRRLSHFNGEEWIEVSNLSIVAMVQTKDETIWFGTPDGLYKFSLHQ